MASTQLIEQSGDLDGPSAQLDAPGVEKDDKSVCSPTLDSRLGHTADLRWCFWDSGSWLHIGNRASAVASPIALLPLHVRCDIQI